MSAALDKLKQPSAPVISILKGPGCPGCMTDPFGILFQQGLQQWPVIQCAHCAARVFVGEEGYRHVIPEDKAPPIRRSFLDEKRYNAEADSWQRSVAQADSEIAEYERKVAFWRRKRAEYEDNLARVFGIERVSVAEAARPCFEPTPALHGLSEGWFPRESNRESETQPQPGGSA